jgi:hypothetical protein
MLSITFHYLNGDKLTLACPKDFYSDMPLRYLQPLKFRNQSNPVTKITGRVVNG